MIMATRLFDPYAPDSAQWARGQANTPGERRAAAALSMIFTAALFALLLLVSAARTEALRPVSAAFALTTIALAHTDPPAAPDLAGAPGGTSARAAGAPRAAEAERAAVTIPPISALPAPLDVIRLAPLDVPHPSAPDETLAVTASAETDSLQAQMASQRGDGGADSETGEGRGAGSGSAAGDGRGQGGLLKASWAPSMDFSQDARFKHYPAAARAAGIEGTAWLKCRVLRRDRVRDCRLLGETPQGHGFGAAALKTERDLRIRLHDETGRRVYDDWTIVTSHFTLADLPQAAAARAQIAEK